MKIALVILHADPARGGAERYTIDLAAALARGGHSVFILATSCAQIPQGVQTVALPARGMTRAGKYRAMLNSLDAHLDIETYDVVHAMLPVRRCDLYHPHAGMAAEATDKCNALLNPRRLAMTAIERKLLAGPRPPVIVALSDYSKRDVLACYPNLPAERLVTLFNAVDLDRFQPTPREHAGVVALMIANDFERKGLSQTIRALAKVGPLNLKLDVIGKQPPGKYGIEAKNLEVADAVLFFGPAADPRPRYAAADFFVLPTRHDPCSLVVLEALAMGLPVISTKFNGACEIMINGVHGYVLDDPDDIDALARAMNNLRDPHRRAEMSQACLALRPRLSYEHHLHQLTAIYERIQSARR